MFIYIESNVLRLWISKSRDSDTVKAAFGIVLNMYIRTVY